MIDMDTSIQRLLEAGVITPQTAYDQAIDKSLFLNPADTAPDLSSMSPGQATHPTTP